jgi:hypothetical protein
MDGLKLADHFLNKIRTRQAEVSETLMANGVKTIEQYQHFMGQVSALGFMEQELKDLLKNVEKMDD